MLDDFIASATATPTPMPFSPHDAYDWWSDIWLPALVGFGSVGAAAAAVIVAWRSARVAETSAEAAQRATAAAERSNELTHQALTHEREQAKLAAERVEAEARARFADRVNARFDEFFEAKVTRSTQVNQQISEIGTLSLESVANGWNPLGLNDWVQFALRVDLDDPVRRRQYFDRHRQAVHTTMVAWAKDPRKLALNRRYFERKLREKYPDEAA